MVSSLDWDSSSTSWSCSWEGGREGGIMVITVIESTIGSWWYNAYMYEGQPSGQGSLFPSLRNFTKGSREYEILWSLKGDWPGEMRECMCRELNKRRIERAIHNNYCAERMFTTYHKWVLPIGQLHMTNCKYRIIVSSPWMLYTSIITIHSHVTLVCEYLVLNRFRCWPLHWNTSLYKLNITYTLCHYIHFIH